MDSCNKIETVYLSNIPLDNLDKLPEYVLMERDVVNEETGEVDHAIVRTPTAKLFPNGNFDNMTTLETNNSAIDEMETAGEVDWKSQVVAGYISNEGSTYVMRLADATHAPVFLMRGEVTPGTMLIQNTGFVVLNAGHSYVVGADYYLGADGRPTTDSSITGWHLFTVLSNIKLAVNIYNVANEPWES